MGEDTFKNILFGLILFTLFAVLVVTAVNYEGALYEKDTTEVTGGALSESQFNSTINTINTQGSTYEERFFKGSFVATIGELVLGGFFQMLRDLWNMVKLPFTLLTNVMVNILHIPTVVIATINILVVLAILFAVWRLLKAGD